MFTAECVKGAGKFMTVTKEYATVTTEAMGIDHGIYQCYHRVYDSYFQLYHIYHRVHDSLLGGRWALLIVRGSTTTLPSVTMSLSALG